MAGRPLAQTNQILERITSVLENMQANRDVQPAEYRGLTTFKKNNPPKFQGGFDPEGAKLWLAEIDKIFEAMGCAEEQKVTFATFMLAEEAKSLWKFTKPSLIADGKVISLAGFKDWFLNNYFPTNIQR